MDAIDARTLRTCLGHFATGVTVVTCPAGETRHGVTVNSFTAVSLDPPLVLVSIARTAKACGFLEEQPFAINVLTAEQLPLAQHFAGRPQEGLTIPWQEGAVAPRLAGSLAAIECRPWRAYDGGDHLLFLGVVETIEYAGGRPLVFYQGRFCSVADQTPIGWGIIPSGGWLPEVPLFHLDADEVEGARRRLRDAFSP